MGAYLVIALEGVEVASQEIVRGRVTAGQAGTLVGLGLCGLLSGVLVWAVISFVWEPYIGLTLDFDLAGWNLSLTHLTLVPGFLFGIIVGLVLSRRGLARLWQVLAYIATATAANFVATNFAAGMVDTVDSALVLGMLAGLIGSGCLTAVSLLLFSFLRRPLPCLLMLAAGTLLGALLEFALEDSSAFGLGFLVLYGAWQAGYAAALGTALPPRQAT